MSITYSEAPDEIKERVKSVIDRYCPNLKEAGVRVDVLSAATDEDGEPAVKLHGYPCGATIQIRTSKLRAMGLGDAAIELDEAHFNALPAKTQDALLHHELHHLELKRNRRGKLQLDEHGRPKMTMRLHDRDFGWFDEIARVHGKHSMEVRQATTLVLGGRQLYFEFCLSGGRVEESSAKLIDSDPVDVSIRHAGKTVFSTKDYRG